MDGGEIVVEQGGDEDLDSFFREKDRRKQERLAIKKAKAKADREQMPPPSAWMTTDEVEQAQYEQFEGGTANAPTNASAEKQTEQVEETSEELAAHVQAQAPIYRPEDDEWIDPEREFAPAPGGKKKHHHAQGPQDDKLLLLVAPAANKLQDLSAISADKIAKAKVTTSSVPSGKGWSKIEAEPAAAVSETAAQVVQKTTEPEPEKKPVEPVPQPEPEPGVYVIRAKRTEPSSSPSDGRSPRTQSPASKPSAETATASYVPPALRRQQQPQQPSPQLGSSRPVGSGLAAVQPKQVAKKVIPDLKNVDEFPSLG